MENRLTLVTPWAPCLQLEKSGPSPSSAPRAPAQTCRSAGKRHNEKLWLMKESKKEKRRGNSSKRNWQHCSNTNYKTRRRAWSTGGNGLDKCGTKGREVVSHFFSCLWTSFPGDRKHGDTMSKKWLTATFRRRIYRDRNINTGVKSGLILWHVALSSGWQR